MTRRKLKSDFILSADTFFYTIPLRKPDQHLTRDMLDEHYPMLGRKAYMGNHCDYISYAHGMLTVEVFLNDGSQNNLFMHVGIEELHVACSCGMPGDKLCLHTYMGLYNMMWQHYLDFQMFYWPGYESDKKIQRKFLQVDVDTADYSRT